MDYRVMVSTIEALALGPTIGGFCVHQSVSIETYYDPLNESDHPCWWHGREIEVGVFMDSTFAALR